MIENSYYKEITNYDAKLPERPYPGTPPVRCLPVIRDYFHQGHSYEAAVDRFTIVRPAQLMFSGAIGSPLHNRMVDLMNIPQMSYGRAVSIAKDELFRREYNRARVSEAHIAPYTLDLPLKGKPPLDENGAPNYATFQWLQLYKKQLEDEATHALWKEIRAQILKEVGDERTIPSNRASLQEIRQFFENNSTLLTKIDVIFLSGNNLYTLPPELKLFKNLDALHLNDNNLWALELGVFNLEALDNLKTLKRLSLIDNKLSILPKEIGDLQDLKELCISSNRFTSFPEQIFNLKNLNTLSIGENKIEHLPKEIGELKNLEMFIINENKLTSIPEELGNLTQLEYLWLDNNAFLTLPKTLLNLKKLEDFSIGNGDEKREYKKIEDVPKTWFALNTFELNQSPSNPPIALFTPPAVNNDESDEVVDSGPEDFNDLHTESTDSEE